MKFTNEDLLKAMGLNVGDEVELNSLVWIIENHYNDIRLHAIGTEKYLKIREILELDYEIFQSKPKLTEEEKIILRNLPRNSKQTKFIGRKMNDDGHGGLIENLWIYQGNIVYDFNLFRHLFKEIEIGEEFSIEELLKGEK